VAYAVNETGTAVGWALAFETQDYHPSHAVRWDANTTIATDLGLGRAYAINDSGVAVGYTTVSDLIGSGDLAVRWAASGNTPTVLGHLGVGNNGHTNAQALAINNAGVAVGFAEKFIGNVSKGEHAVYWSPDGMAVDLNTLISPTDGWTLTRAYSISDTGWIMGYGFFEGDPNTGYYSRLFLMHVPAAAVPEPSTIALAAGAAALLLGAYRTQRTKLVRSVRKRQIHSRPRG
jgi:hypothetical protein